MHYHYVSRETFEQDIAEGKFLEHAHVNGNIYGTSFEAIKAVIRKGKSCILDIDVQGAMLVKESDLRRIFVFIMPPSFEVLENRLRGRGTEQEAQVVRRLQTAKEELEL